MCKYNMIVAMQIRTCPEITTKNITHEDKTQFYVFATLSIHLPITTLLLKRSLPLNIEHYIRNW